MFRVELEFDTTLPKETVNKYCEETDRIFAEEHIPCAEASFGKRCYIDVRGEEDYGYMWAALMGIRRIKEISSKIIKGLWIDEEHTEILTNGFF